MEILLLVVVVLVIALLVFRRASSVTQQSTRPVSAKTKAGTSDKKAATKSTPQASKPYRSTSIRCGEGACEAALALQDQRLLVDEVPRLPLADCSSATCNCRYVHHDDRREPRGERRALAGLSTELYADSGKEERRTGNKPRGRRESDHLGSE